MIPKNVDLKSPFDVIVIGSGIGGLTSAALLAKAGKSVLVLEQHDRAGGYAHGFNRKRYHFDSGVHLISGCEKTGYHGGQIVYKVLQAVGVYQQLEFVRINPFSYVDYPAIQMTLPLTIEDFVIEMVMHFPDQEQGLRELLDVCLKVSEQVSKTDEVMATQDTTRIKNELNLVFRYSQATLADVWGDFIQNKQLQAIFASHWPYLGLPPSKVSFIYWATMLIGYLVDGAYYCKGGFQKLADALVSGIIQQGGRVIYKTTVEKIEVIDNQVQGLTLSTGENFRAKTIISNADMRQTVYKMIGEGYFPKRYLSRLKRMQPSQSLFVVYLATNLDLATMGVHHEGFYYDEIDHEKNYENALKSEKSLKWLSITVPTLVDSSLAPKGEHLIVLTRLVSFDSQQDWQKVKPLFVEKMLDYAEKKIPTLKDNILFIDSGSPATLERYTSNYKGAAYGWNVTPNQAGANRVANKAPIEGLYFSGHWTTPGGGVYGVCFSGLLAAQQILEIRDQQKFWDFLN